jgi:hypothetical protein
MKVIHCGEPDCDEKILVEATFRKGAKSLNKHGWKKVGEGVYWNYYCPACSFILEKALNLK